MNKIKSQNRLFNLEYFYYTKARLLWEIIQLPKIDLHRHLTGSINAELARKIAAKYDVDLPTYSIAELHSIITSKPKPLSQYDYFRRWKILNKLFISQESTYEITMEIIKKASEDNVIYMELRMGPREFLNHNYKNSKFTFYHFLEAINSAVHDGEKKFGTITRCILGVSKGETIAKVKNINTINNFFRSIIRNISKYYPDCFVGVDLNGIEEDGEDYNRYKYFFDMARDSSLKTTVHSGELGSNRNVENAIRILKPDRIGHGLATTKQRHLMEILADKDIPLEICPSSNKLLKVIYKESDLPLEILLKNKVQFVICTDNPAVCQTNLSEELFNIAFSFGFSIKDIKNLIKQSLKYCFADEELKIKLFNRIEGRAQNGLKGSIEKTSRLFKRSL